MSADRLFDEPGGHSDDAARIAALEAELEATRLQSEARRVENEQLRAELAAHEACASVPSGTDSGDADTDDDGGFCGGAVPSPATVEGMLRTLERCQADLQARAAGADVGDVRAVGRDLVGVIEASRRLQAFGFAIQAEALAGLNQVQHLPVLPAGVCSAAMRTETLTGAEAAAALLVSRDSARARTADALMLTRVFTRTLQALRQGWVTDWHAKILLSETAHLDDEQRRRVEDEVLDYADGRTGPELRRKIKRVVARIAPVEAEDAHARAREGRRVWAQPGLDGMGTLGAELPVEDLAAVMTAIEAAAAAAKTANPDDGRTMDNRRADALAAMGWTALAGGHIGKPAAPANSRTTNGGTAHSGTAHSGTQTGTDTGECGDTGTPTEPATQQSTDHGGAGARAGVQPDGHAHRQDSAQDQESGEDSAQSSARDGPETGAGCCCGAVSTETSAAAAGSGAGGGLRLQNTRGKPVTVNVTVPYSTLIGIDDYPGQLAGYGTITASVARRIAAHGSWRRILTDPVNGAPLDYGQTRYEPPPDLAAFIALRDGTCVMPGCNRTAQASQVDHTIPYADGGATAHDNLGSLDQVCHLLKTFADWSVTQDPHRPGRFDWTSPLGYRRTVTPEPVGPIVQAEAGPGKGPEQQDIPPF